MKRVFIESENFREKIEHIAEDELLNRIQNPILEDPNLGDVIQGTGGLRKIRVAAKGKGTSGGVRIFYLDLPIAGKCYLLFLLEKSERENISVREKNEIKRLVTQLKKSRPK